MRSHQTLELEIDVGGLEVAPALTCSSLYKRQCDRAHYEAGSQGVSLGHNEGIEFGFRL